ncbi:MAG: hypothetical protein P4L58_00455 [Candidatus Pacebacteria bacterium]|nr:hypothetical protein [Candidatus Paceibacterota bacterium]
MIDFIYNQIIFYLAIFLVMFLPGWFLLLAIFGKSKILSTLERFVISFALGLVVMDFIAFAYYRPHIPLTAETSILGSLIFSAVCYGIYKHRQNKAAFDSSSEASTETKKLFSFSKNQLILLLLFIFLTIFIRTVYLTGTVAPTATDMGHHTYWAKVIAETHAVTNYGGSPTFIIGEHVALAEIYMITGLSVFSAFPVMFLFLVNILGIMTAFILTIRIFKNKTVAILSILFLGVLYAVTSPQAKYISGGVIGNIIGDYLMPLMFYFYYRAFEFLREGNYSVETQSKEAKSFLALAVFTTFGLFYTHHLTAFIFLFIFAFLFVFYLLINFGNIKKIFLSAWQVIWSPSVMATFFVGLFFFFVIFTPSYIKGGAVNTAVGVSTKGTRVGLTLTNLKNTMGEARAAMGIIGLIILVLAYRRKDLGIAIVVSWTVMLFIMSTEPHFLLVNLPSDRIGNYLSYPLAILAAYGFWAMFKPSKVEWKYYSKTVAENLVPLTLLKSAFIIILAFVLIEGVSDSAQAFKKAPNFTPLNEVFAAAQYLDKNSTDNDVILKDHNYLTGDTWIKSFFMRGYDYPLSRSYFKRYDGITDPSKLCTLVMISNPGADDANQCFASTKTDFIMINPSYDSSQFVKLDNFNEIYVTDGVAVYYRK